MAAKPERTLWKTVWRSVSLPDAQGKPPFERAGKWLFCGIPTEHISDFINLLRSSGIEEAGIIGAGTINDNSPLPNLACEKTIGGIIFVTGLWQSQKSIDCAFELQIALLAYCRSAEGDPTFDPPFCVVTSNCNSSFGIPSCRPKAGSSDDLDLRHAGLLSMCRTARLEIQRLCKRPFRMLFVNVEDKLPSSLARAWSWIAAQFEVLRSNPTAPVEDDAVISENCCMVPRIAAVSVPPQPRESTVVLSSKSYLITGGTGGLGVAVAQWLLNLGAGLVVLLSRSGKPAEALKQTSAWQTLQKGFESKRVEVMICDVASKQLAQDALAKVHHKLPVGGVFHCAGFEGEPSILNSSLKSIRSVYEPKVDGAWNLHCACQQLDIERCLDFFVLFSSISTLPGNDALATYASANAYLDSLAYWRTSQGLRAQSIQWGPWIDVGMVTRNSKFDRVFASRGIRPFKSAEAIRLMELALQTSEACICAVAVDWRKYSQAFDRQVPMSLAELAGEATSGAGGSNANAPALPIIEAAVFEAVASLVDCEGDVGASTRLDDLGLDSLGSVELRNMIQERLGMSLPASLLLEFSTLGEVIDYIAEDVSKRQSTSQTGALVPKKTLFQGSEDGFAVVGVGCRLPGNSNSPEEFWEMLLAGTDCVKDIPWQRFNIQALFDPDPEENKCYVKEAALLENAHLFDNEFFRLTASQARNIDPQQRVLLEVAYETFVDAQYHRNELKGQDIGVFCATYTNEYQLSSLTKGENGILAVGEGADGGVPRLGEASGYPEPGGLMCLIPNRISYSMGLIGPSIGVDTACASGLVALDTAMMKLKLSACSKAFVGAVSLILAPCFFIGGSKTRQFSKSGRCRTFDAGADGLVRGEGAAGVLLAPLRTARSEAKFVHAIVRGTATSHYGQGARLTAPNTRALVRVLNQALQDGGVEQSSVRCYEAHGTATVLGDIIEMNALKQVFENRLSTSPLVVGTAHNNIGHLDSAAALVAFIKTILTLKHRYVPPNIQFNKLHPDIGIFDTCKIIYTREGQDIRVQDKSTKIFGANLAYGLGGTVVAAITEEGDDPRSAPKVS